MTRQKKELIKKIDDLYRFIAVDEQLGCGNAPAGAYDELYEQIYNLQDQLALLSHYESVEEMMNDTREQTGGVVFW